MWVWHELQSQADGKEAHDKLILNLVFFMSIVSNLELEMEKESQRDM